MKMFLCEKTLKGIAYGLRSEICHQFFLLLFLLRFFASLHEELSHELFKAKEAMLVVCPHTGTAEKEEKEHFPHI